MYPAFKINKDFWVGYVGNFDFKKNGYTNLAECELKQWHNRISVALTVIMRFGFENLYKSGWWELLASALNFM